MKTEIGEYLSLHRDDLVRFATLQLRDIHHAEDVVQQATLAALESADRFKGNSSLRTWVFAILKNKIIDQMRRGTREQPFSDLATDIEDQDMTDHFDQRGFWQVQSRPKHWSQPDESLDDKQFWVIFEMCLNYLPARTAQVFMMREHLDLDTDEICAELGLSSSNCWVILHRARNGLRECLQEHWFTAA